ncbi:MAG TPA: response regulator [Pelovirga sp.]|nr:response regulator [Pelovirga sp.]
MKFLIVEDEFSTRLILQNILNQYGEVHVAVNGREAAQAVKMSLDNKTPYSLITLDVVMPEMNGQEALKKIRQLENDHDVLHANRARVIMTTSMNNGKSIMSAFKEQCDGYLVKPIDRSKLENFVTDLEKI